MRTRTTMATAAVTAVLALALTACSSDEDGDDKAAVATTSSAPASASPSTEPSLSQEEIASQCTDAIAEAAPGWDDWNYSPGGWEDDPRTPEECLPLADEGNPPRGNRAFMAALIAGLELADDPRARQ